MKNEFSRGDLVWYYDAFSEVTFGTIMHGSPVRRYDNTEVYRVTLVEDDTHWPYVKHASLRRGVQTFAGPTTLLTIPSIEVFL